MNHLVRIIRNDDGDLQPSHKDWHLVDPGAGDATRTLCGGEAFGEGESSCEFEEKTAHRGGITCPDCLEKLKIYKAVKL